MWRKTVDVLIDIRGLGAKKKLANNTRKCKHSSKKKESIRGDGGQPEEKVKLFITTIKFKDRA